MITTASAPRDFNNDALVNTCRHLRRTLSQKIPSTLRVVAPQVADAIPQVIALCIGIEDLADRVRLLEIARQ